jgi:hypothetical protein
MLLSEPTTRLAGARNPGLLVHGWAKANGDRSLNVKTAARVLARALLCYLLGGAALTIALSWNDLSGHPHVPFSGFPAVLVWSPVAPVMLVAGVGDSSMVEWAGFLGGLGVGAIAFFWMPWRMKGRRSSSGS